MESGMNHEDKQGMHPMMPGQHGPMMHGHWRGSWKSPIGLGFFLLTASLALAIFLYTVLNLVGVIIQAEHPASQGLSAQQMQQLEQQSAPASATTGQ
jgi:hypothetical protein